MIRFLSILFLGFILLTTSCAPPQPEDVIAKVEGDPIVVQEIIQGIYREKNKWPDQALQDPKKFLDFKYQILDSLIQQRILVQEAQKAKVEISEEDLNQEIRNFKSRYTEKDFQAVLKSRGIDYSIWLDFKRHQLLANRFLEEKVFSNISVSEDEIQQYYHQHQKEFTSPESVHVRQIVTDNRGSAEAILERLKKGENFARLAHDLSIAPERLEGGDLGFVSREGFLKEFEICFDLKEGELSPIIPSLYGFHIFKVIEKHPETLLTLEQVSGQIKDWLIRDKREDWFQSYYQKLKNQYKVEVHSWSFKKIQMPLEVK